MNLRAGLFATNQVSGKVYPILCAIWVAFFAPSSRAIASKMCKCLDFERPYPQKLELVDGWKHHRLTFIAYSSQPNAITKMFSVQLAKHHKVEFWWPEASPCWSVGELKCPSVDDQSGRNTGLQICCQWWLGPGRCTIGWKVRLIDTPDA